MKPYLLILQLLLQMFTKAEARFRDYVANLTQFIRFESVD